MRIYPLISPERAGEIAAVIRGQSWDAGVALREFGQVKVTQELAPEKNPAIKPYLDEIIKAVGASPLAQREVVSSMFYPRFSRYADGGQYKVHVDAAYMGDVRTDLAMTVFLNDDYEGGELCVEGVLPNDEIAKVRAAPGHAVVYECWRPHWVEPVTRGERLVAVTWLQSKIRDAEGREILHRLRVLIDDIERKQMDDQQRFAALGAIHDKLVKRFAQ